MARTKKITPVAPKRPKIKRSHYFDADLWDRLQSFARRQDPPVTDSACIDAALRRYLDFRENRNE